MTPRTLADILNGYRNKDQSLNLDGSWMYSSLQGSTEYSDYSVRWRLRNARLIAEAVLRFELFEQSDLKLHKHIVYYRLSTALLEPFLTVTIPKNSQPSRRLSAAGESQQGIRVKWMQELLVELGVVLLFLGLSPKDMPLENWSFSTERGRLCIEEEASRTEMGINYFKVLVSCANFFQNEQEMPCSVADFREKYFEKIVQPLQDAESSFQR